MVMIVKRAFFFCLLFTFPGFVFSQVDTGPPPGTELTPVQAYAPVGPWAGQEFDAAAAIGKKPGALLFIHTLTRNGLPVIRGLDQIGSQYSLLGFSSFTFLLSDDRTSAETRLKAVNGSLKLHSPIVLSLDGIDGPGNYALNRKAVLSLIMLKDGKVHSSVGFTDVNAEDENLIRKWIEDVSGKLPDDSQALEELAKARLPENPDELRTLAATQAVELHRLRMQVADLKKQNQENRMRERTMRGSGEPMRQRSAPAGKPDRKKPGDATPQAAERKGKPPTDPALDTLLRAFIRKDNTTETNEKLLTDIEARAAENESLKAEAIAMFELMLSFRERYGSEKAQGLAEAFLKKHQPTE